ncbi:MAG TPA: VOC family protein [Pseudorhodoplanes sp.]|jgi:hypothetical protein|nr:VOC family protein [Pseudorhodoplanes sp.]
MSREGTVSVSESVDVPSLEEGIRFYAAAFGFEVTGRPVPEVAVLKAVNTTLCLLEKKAGTRRSPRAADVRRYDRHWTPVHLDLHVGDLDAALARALAVGANQEQVFRDAEHGSAAFCSGPFCLIQR